MRMTRETMTGWMTATMLLTVPLPFFLVETGIAPASRLLMLGAVCAAAAITEPGFTTILFATLLLTQVGFFGSALWLIARALARRIEGRVAGKRRTWIVVGLCATLFAVAQLDIYRTPFSQTSFSTNLWRSLD